MKEKNHKKVKEPIGDTKTSKRQDSAVNRKRTRSKTNDEDLNVTVAGESSKKKTAKRKINFNENQEKQSNNNAMIVNVDEHDKRHTRKNTEVSRNDPMKNVSLQTRSRNLNERSGRTKIANKASGRDSLESGKVKWTKEFMDKVRKSNQRHEQLLKERNIKKNSDILQDKDREVKAGDGIQMLVDGGDMDSEIELLDYEDDLSMEGDFEEWGVESQESSKVPRQNTKHVSGGPPSQPEPCTSRQQEQNLAANLQEEDLINNPVIQNMMKKFFNEQFKNVSATNNATSLERHVLTGKEPGRLSAGNNQISGLDNKNRQQLKSPSDMTIYAPAMQRKLTPTNQNEILYVTQDECGVHQIVSSSRPMHGLDGVVMPPQGNTLVQQQGNISGQDYNSVSAFVEAIRLNEHPTDEVDKRRTTAANMDQAQTKAERMIIEAEKFWAAIELPGMPIFHSEQQQHQDAKGMNGPNAQDGVIGNEQIGQIGKGLTSMLDIGSGVSDDDFFHLTCHIEPNLIHRIEKGEFVELEKMLPKDKVGGLKDENRLEWVQREGGTFLVPAQKDNKISGFRRWEQAFRAYATIYCGANPHQAKEIWQYITVINTAASSYIWDNVYNYDITFRHLMAFNPNCSWAVTYNQMWNLSMKDPLPKNNYKSAYNHYSGGGVAAPHFQGGSSSSNPMQVRRIKSDYCWNFNKGVPCKFGPRCKFIERCKYCDSPSHGVNACLKLQKKEGQVSKTTGINNNNNGNSNNSSNINAK